MLPRGQRIGEIDLVRLDLTPRTPAAPLVVGRPGAVGPARAVGIDRAVFSAVGAPGMEALHHHAVDRDDIRLGDELVLVAPIGAVAGRGVDHDHASEPGRHDHFDLFARSVLLCVEALGVEDRRGPARWICGRVGDRGQLHIDRPRRMHPGIDEEREVVAIMQERRETRDVEGPIGGPTVRGHEARELEVGRARHDQTKVAGAIPTVVHAPLVERNGMDGDLGLESGVSLRPWHRGFGKRDATVLAHAIGGVGEARSRIGSEEDRSGLKDGCAHRRPCVRACSCSGDQKGERGRDPGRRPRSIASYLQCASYACTSLSRTACGEVPSIW